MSLLREIQHDVAGSGSDAATVLRKCKILASRLHSMEFDQWLAWELDGYPLSQQTPDYRRLTVTHYASFHDGVWNVPKAAVPLQLVPEEHREAFTFIEFRDGIAKADSLARSKNVITIERPEAIFALQGKMYPEMNCHHVWGEISSIEFQQLLSAVRNRVLDFSLKVEAENPNSGEAPPNSQPVPEEKLRPLVQNIFYGTVGAVAQDSKHFNQTVAIDVSPQEIVRLVNEFETHIDELALNHEERRRAEAQISTLKAESVQEPDVALVRQAARSLRNITEGAIGSLIATAATQPPVWHWILQTLTKLSSQ
jgi:AbiTii